jgi:hypothetical protein
MNDMKFAAKACALFCFGLVYLIGITGVYAQTRINDKDLERLMHNLRDDAKSFRQPFTSALRKSTIRKTSQEKDAENLAALFERQTEALLNNFKRTQKGDSSLSAVQSSAQQVGDIVSRYHLGPQVTSRWEKIRTELGQVLAAYGITGTEPTAENPRGITPGSGEGSGACSQAVGQERADRLVKECLQVSPATHPPCNVQNSCVMIIDEIKRGCGLLEARNRPAFCAEYQ